MATNNSHLRIETPLFFEFFMGSFKSLFRLSLIPGVFFALAAISYAQTPTPTPSVDVIKTFEVRLPVTVTDKEAKGKEKDKLVSGLARNDFVILEDGVPQEVTFFSDETTNPAVFVGVLMDTSPSTAGKLGFSKEAAKNFIYSVTRLRKDKAAFMTFDHNVVLHQDFTDKLDLLDRAVDKVKKTGSNTALYDAIWQFTDEKLRNMPGRRVIVVITDGDDTFSRADLADAIDIAQRTETTIFGISTKAGFLGTVPGVDAGTVKDKGDRLLVELCEKTGGEAFFTGDMIELERAFTRISKELRSQYIITYRPANQAYDGRPRKIEVRFTDTDRTKKYKIRSKDSYRAIRDTLK
ncbi:MAG TPA: VWA domain-containing protein [Pyrinomonadaceae bacterium]|nr:VWA domain-containing protein [Pyrinomonadaceae bacterium]